MKVQNTVSGQVAVVVGAWRNIAGQVVLNVRPDTMRSGFVCWNAVEVAVIETNKAA